MSSMLFTPSKCVDASPLARIRALKLTGTALLLKRRSVRAAKGQLDYNAIKAFDFMCKVLHVNRLHEFASGLLLGLSIFSPSSSK